MQPPSLTLCSHGGMSSIDGINSPQNSPSRQDLFSLEIYFSRYPILNEAYPFAAAFMVSLIEEPVNEDLQFRVSIANMVPD